MPNYYALNAAGRVEALGEFDDIDEAFDSKVGLTSFYVADEVTAKRWYEQLKVMFGDLDAPATNQPSPR